MFAEGMCPLITIVGQAASGMGMVRPGSPVG
jgi:hypothetical protein